MTGDLPFDLLFLRRVAHGDDDGADEGGSQEQTDHFERQDEPAHQNLADAAHGDLRRRRNVVRQSGAFGERDDEHREHGQRHHHPAEPARRQHWLPGRLAAARQQDGEHDQDGHGPDVHKDLREPDELGVQLQVHRGQAGEGDGKRQRAVHQVPQPHGRHRRADGHSGNDGKG